MKGISSKEPSGVLLDAPTQGPPRDFGNSVDHEKSVRPFKGIFCRDISEFESYMPSQPVRSPPLLAGGPPKSAQIGPIRRNRLSLLVPDRATKASFRLSVSEGHFWCLVFGRCGCSVKNSNERSRPPLSGECRLKRLVAGVSGYIFDECVTKCVAVLKQHGGFTPTAPSRRSKAD